ncbi:MAG: phospholipase D-like domain-containing protein [Phycisphaerales bacterium]
MKKELDLRSVPLPPLWCVAGGQEHQRRERPTPALLWQTGKTRVAAARALGIIGRAREVVVVCSFLLSDSMVIEALEAAARRGVRVYVMLAAETRLLSEPPDNDVSDKGVWQRQVIADFRSLLRRLGGLTMIRASDQFHAKVVIADPSTHPVGLLFTANLTEDALSRNQELAVELSASQVRATWELLRWAFWEAATHEVLDGAQDGLGSIRALGELELLAPDDRMLCTAERLQVIRDAMLGSIQAEKVELIVASFGWSAEHEVVQALADRAKAGVRVTVFSRPRAASMPALVLLAESGARVLGFKHLHAKALWTASGDAIVTSANLEPHGLDSGFELGILLAEPERAALRRVFGEWQEAAESELHVGKELGSLRGKVLLWSGGKLEEQEIVEHASVNLPRRELPSAELLLTEEAGSPRSELPLAHRIEVTEQLVAPTSPAGARDISAELAVLTGGATGSSGDLRLLSKNGRRLLVIRDADQLPLATKLRPQVNADAIVFERSTP